jgi:hypothetical protein
MYRTVFASMPSCMGLFYLPCLPLWSVYMLLYASSRVCYCYCHYNSGLNLI